MSGEWQEFTEHRLNKLETIATDVSEKLSDLTSVVMGPPPGRTNGLQGTLKKLVEKVDKTVDWANDIWNNKRRTECISLPEIKIIKEEIAAMKKQQSNITAAKLNLRGVYVMGGLQFLGGILIALIASGKL